MRSQLSEIQMPGNAAVLPGPKQAAGALARAPMVFEANLGQTDPSVQFLTHGRGYTAFLTSTDQVLVLSPPST